MLPVALEMPRLQMSVYALLFQTNFYCTLFKCKIWYEMVTLILLYLCKSVEKLYESFFLFYYVGCGCRLKSNCSLVGPDLFKGS